MPPISVQENPLRLVKIAKDMMKNFVNFKMLASADFENMNNGFEMKNFDRSISCWL